MKLLEVWNKLEFATEACSFACNNPHWWLHRQEDGKYAYEYECCDSCDNGDFEIYDTFWELRDQNRHLDMGDDDWALVKQ